MDQSVFWASPNVGLKVSSKIVQIFGWIVQPFEVHFGALASIGPPGFRGSRVSYKWSSPFGRGSLASRVGLWGGFGTSLCASGYILGYFFSKKTGKGGLGGPGRQED